MRTKLQGGTIVGFDRYTHVLMRDGVVVWEAEAYWAMYPQLSWDGHTAAETFPNAFPWVEGPL